MAISFYGPITFRISSYADKVLNKVSSKIPNFVVDSQSLNNGIKWVGKHISSPQNRLILGVSALLSQPFIDLHNRRVDEKTRKTSAARTVAKIIAGTTTGFLVRYYSIKLVDKMAQIPSKKHPVGSWSTFLSPDRSKVMYKKLDHYKYGLGTALAIGTMVITNFIIDAPLTKYLTNKFIKRIEKNEQNKLAKQSLEAANQNITSPKPNTQKKYFGETNLIRQKVQEHNIKNRPKEVYNA